MLLIFKTYRKRLLAAMSLAAFSILLVNAAVGLSPLADLDANALAAKFDAHYNRLASLRAGFTERFTGLNLDRTESGTLTMKKPGRMRWDYSLPIGKVFVLDGTNAWFYSPGDSEAQKVPASRLDDLRSPMRYLLGHAHLEKELVGLRATSIPGGYRLMGVPVGMEQRVQRVALDVTDEGQLMGIRVEDTDGTATEFRFSNMKENVPLENSYFLFTPPDGIPVVDAMPPI